MQLVNFIFLALVGSLGFSKAHVHKEEVVVKMYGGPIQARMVANEMGYNFIGPVKGFQDMYILIPMQLHIEATHQKRGVSLNKRLVDDDRVVWAEQQNPKSRQKRDLLSFGQQDWEYRPKGMRRNSPIETAATWQKPIRIDRSFNDELWSQQWYLQDTRTEPDLPKLDLNVLPLYRYGVTGKGVRISILDDGIEYTHDDLKRNYDADISYDCNEEDDDPLPRYDPEKQNSHGTRCAGEVAMTADNGKCGVGIAFNARIGAVKLLDGLVNDRIEGTALSHARHLVDIYSASWGPTDDGKTVDGPGRLAQEALLRGVQEGRNGKGSIFVWASGNGGSQGDNCNCDGYLTSPYTISIGSASQRGEFPWYGEACASTLAVTYSSGAYQDQMIATTDMHNECTIKHTGTSASAPLAAGIVALALEVNPELTWRDVQHLIVWTSELAPVADNPGWTRNAAGLWTNTRFGFGLMNAFGFVAAAANWTRVPQKYTCHVMATPMQNSSFSYGSPAMIPIKTTGCANTRDEVVHLEHVEVKVDIDYTVRGAIEIHLKSPRGTQVQVLGTRKLDKSSDGFRKWKFMSVMTWGETAEGLWVLHVADKLGPEGNFGNVSNVSLILHGTREPPAHTLSGPREYNHEYNRVRNRVGSLLHETLDQFYGYDTNLLSFDGSNYFNQRRNV